MEEPPVFPLMNDLNNLIPVSVSSLFIWDVQQIAITVAHYVANGDEAAMAFQLVPGGTTQCKVVSDRVTNTFAALVYWMALLHKLQYSLNGAFFLDGFRIIHNGSLKGTRDLFNLLVPLDDVSRSHDMSRLAVLASDDLYRTHIFGPVPLEVQDLLNILANFQPNQYLLVKSHPGLRDAMEKSLLFTHLNSMLQAMKTRDPVKFNNVIGNINQIINNPSWVCRGVQNVFIHQLLRFDNPPNPPNPLNIPPNPQLQLRQKIMRFLTTNVKCGKGTGEDCLTARRNGEAHLIKDYCGVANRVGTEEALRAAHRAITIKIPGLVNAPANLAPNPQGYLALRQTLRAPFQAGEAQVITDAIMEALNTYQLSTVEADAAATAAASYLAWQARQLGFLYMPNPPMRVVPTWMVPHSAQAQNWQFQQQQLDIQNYSHQVMQTRNAAHQAAQQARMVLQQENAAAHPLMARNMFDVKDVSRMFDVMEPVLLCILHRCMFDAGELGTLEWHWVYKAVNLAD